MLLYIDVSRVISRWTALLSSKGCWWWLLIYLYIVDPITIPSSPSSLANLQSKVMILLASRS